MVDHEEDESHAFKGSVADIDHIAVKAFAAMNQLRKSEKLCDIRIQAGSLEFPAHKVVLAAHSPYFAAMFTGQFQESEKSVINIPSITANVMSIILEYFYTGNIELTESSGSDVIQASNFLQITPLIESCCKILLENINSGNCLGLYTLGKLISCAKLRDKSKRYILVNFSKVCQGAEFLELDPDSLLDIIDDDSLPVQNEEYVFHAIMQWHSFKAEERLLYLPEVLSHVRLWLLSSEFLEKYIKTKELFFKSAVCLQQTIETARLLQVGDPRLQSSLSRKRNAPFDEAMLVICTHLWPKGTPAPEYKTELFNISINGLVLNEIQKPRKIESFYVSQCRRLLLGSHRDTIWRYDSSLNDWHVIAPLNKRRFSFGLCEVDGFWYAMGGYLPGTNYHTHVFNNVERYQPTNNVWIEVAPMPIAVLRPTVLSLQGMLYVFGGETIDDVASGFVQRFDPRSNLWSILPSFRGSPDICQACSVFQHIYLFSRGEKTSYQVLDTSTNTWEDCPVSSHRLLCGPVVYKDKIYIVSEDYADTACLPVVYLECYSPSTGRWNDVGVFPNFQPVLMYPPLRIEPSRKAHLEEDFILRALRMEN